MALRSYAAGLAVLGALSLAGCHRGTPKVNVTPVSEGISRVEVEKLWTEALGRFTTGKWSKAATLFERVSLEVPATDTLAIAARFHLAECYFAQGSQLQAAREFRKVSDDTPTAPLAPEALLRAADAYADLWRRPELDDTYGQTAKSTYQELLNRYPDAPAAARARARMVELDDLFAQKEYRAALFYFRLKAYDSAILYLKDLAATYPRASITPEALLTLVATYQKIGYHEDLVETCGYIRRFHPSTAGLDAACPVPAGS